MGCVCLSKHLGRRQSILERQWRQALRQGLCWAGCCVTKEKLAASSQQDLAMHGFAVFGVAISTTFIFSRAVSRRQAMHIFTHHSFYLFTATSHPMLPHWHVASCHCTPPCHLDVWPASISIHYLSDTVYAIDTTIPHPHR